MTCRRIELGGLVLSHAVMKDWSAGMGEEAISNYLVVSQAQQHEYGYHRSQLNPKERKNRTPHQACSLI